MEFLRLERKAEVPANYRLATFLEAQTCLDILAVTLGRLDIVRLMNGWVEGPAHGMKLAEEYRPHMGHKLAVKVTDANSGLITLSDAGWKNAFLYDCEEGYPDQHRALGPGIANEKGWTPLHSAALGGHAQLCERLLREGAVVDAQTYPGHDIDFVYMRYKRGISPLHVAALYGRKEVIKVILTLGSGNAWIRDEQGDTPLHFAMEDTRHGAGVATLLVRYMKAEDAFAFRSANNQTVFHLAVAAADTDAGSPALVGTLLEMLDKEGRTDEIISERDAFGQTPLYMAIKTTNLEVIGILLDHNRVKLSCLTDQKGRTPLHYAVLLSRQGRRVDKFVRCISRLLEHARMANDTHDLFWAEAQSGEIAYLWAKHGEVQLSLARAVQNEYVTPSNPETSLQRAAKSKLMRLSRQLLRDDPEYDNYEQLRDRKWRKSLEKSELENVMEVERFLRNQIIFKDSDMIHDLCEQATDLPTLEDSLGRKSLAEALATLLLNPYTGIPITVGIYGDWGLGKSSLMWQVEVSLLQTAIHQALIQSQMNTPNTLSQHGKEVVHGISKAIKLMLKDKKEVSKLKSDIEVLKYFSTTYHRRYRRTYKSLALTDVSTLVSCPTSSSTPAVADGSTSDNAPKSLLTTPAILTVQYNAWQYQDETQALAGLAVEVIKEMEAAMTMAQWLSMCWCYAWKKQRGATYLKLFFPVILTCLLAGLVSWVAWTLLSRTSNADIHKFKYGSLPLSVVVVSWVVMGQLYKIVQPVSSKLIKFLSPLNHQANLGYQLHVIEDIQFLMQEVSRKPAAIWQLLGKAKWFWALLGQHDRDYVEGTQVPKQIPPKNLRLIAFVDDLDRCKEDAILQVLSAINLVLSVCEINVVLGVDKLMVRRAIQNQIFKDDQCSEELADMFLRKIIQLPLTLPDPGDHQFRSFIAGQMGFVHKQANGKTPASRDSIGSNGVNIRVDTRNNTSDEAENQKNEDDEEVEKDEEDEEALNNDMLSARYSANECSIFMHLQEYTTDDHRLPREWKRVLNYHRLASNVISKSARAEEFSDWNIELLVWVFVCWHWKDLMNEIIKKWVQDLKSMWPKVTIDEGASTSNSPEGPEEQEQEQEPATVEHIKAGPSLKAIVEYKHKIEVVSKEKEEWAKLLDLLQEYDVSMQGIQAFQDFRFNCDRGFLPWPLLEEESKGGRSTLHKMLSWRQHRD